MELWEYGLTYGSNGRAHFRQCEAVDHVRTTYPRLGVESRRCGGTAMRGVSWEGLEGRHDVLVCDRHTLAYIGPMVRE